MGFACSLSPHVYTNHLIPICMFCKYFEWLSLCYILVSFYPSSFVPESLMKFKLPCFSLQQHRNQFLLMYQFQPLLLLGCCWVVSGLLCRPTDRHGNLKFVKHFDWEIWRGHYEKINLLWNAEDSGNRWGLTARMSDDKVRWRATMMNFWWNSLIARK